jgi:hypothetical protein
MKRYFSRTLFVVLLGLIAGSALSQQPSASVQGLVVEAGSNAPVAKATVYLRSMNGYVVASTLTDRDGKFYLLNLSPGSYRFVTAHAGHVTETGPVFTLAAGQSISTARVAMIAGGVISGRITDRGKPVGLADAVALKAVWTEGQLSMRPVIAVRTDDTGEFHLFWLPPGRYYVVGVVWDIANSVGTFVNPDDAEGNRFFTQRFVGRAVFMRATGGGILANEAHVPIYYPGTYEPQLARTIEVQPGSVIRGIDIDAGPVRTRRVTGRVSGLPPQTRGTVEMNLITASLNTAEALAPTISTDINGNFELNSVAPGRYYLVGKTPDLIVRTLVEVRDADLNGVVLSLVPRVNVSGKVSIDGGVPPNVLSNLRVMIRQDPFRPIVGASTVTVRPDGTFVSTGNIQGDYRVLVPPLLSPPSADETTPNLPPALQNLYVKSIRMGDRDLLGDQLHLDSASQEPLTIVIGTNTGAMDGRVVDGRQQPAQGKTVVLVHDNGLRYRVNGKVAVSDSAGRFEFQHVAPGNYKLFAWERIDRGAWNDPEYMKTFESHGVPVRLEEGGKITLNVSMIER